MAPKPNTKLTSIEKSKPVSTFNDYLELARLWKPAGTLAFHIPLLFGSLISVLVNGDLTLNPRFAILNVYLLAASFFQRGAACAWNDAADGEFDKQVARTRDRPIPRGSVSPGAARVWALALAICWVQAVLSVDSKAAWTLLPNTVLNLAYPYMKRFTDYPQVFLGFTFSCNVMTGFMMTAKTELMDIGRNETILGALGATVLGQVAFTCFYDTIYAYQDYADDLAAGVRSMALILGDDVSGRMLLAIMALVQFVCLVVAGVFLNLGTYYFLVSCGGSVLVTGYALISCDLKSPIQCGTWFKRCLVYGGAAQCGGLLMECLRRG